jgi:capsule assembly protein Wzi
MNEFHTGLRLRFVFSIAVAAFSTITTPQLEAQARSVSMLDFTTGSDYEDYLRVLQIAGKVPLYPWSIRGFSRREIEKLALADSTGPWKLRDKFSSSHFSAGPLRLGTTFNSAYPYGANDGPLWAGRGLTVAGSGGVSGYLGPLSFAIDPMAFSAANRPFELMPNGETGLVAFNHGTHAGSVDFPQRFGDHTYSRFDPGNSYVRLDSRFISLGVSTANEWIGPATEYPFLLSNNAPGFPHLFVGTGDPWNIWIGQAQGRIFWGRLDQSAYSPVTGPAHYGGIYTGTVRLATSLDLVFQPRGIPGLELGAARFFHVPYTVGSPNAAFWRKPFFVFFTKSEFASGDTLGAENQLASIFFRWVFPHSGFEVFGERGYEDQMYDFREFLENLDHDREYMLGFQKVLATRVGGFDVLRAELINYQISNLGLLRLGEGAVYLHSPLRQGHTNRGQLLGASAGVNAAAASSLAWTRYSRAGRTTITLRRIVRDQEGDYYLTGLTNPRGSDVLVAAGFERMRYGRMVDLGAKIEVMDELNRNFVRDVGNLNLQLTARLHR